MLNCADKSADEVILFMLAMGLDLNFANGGISASG